MVKLAILWHMHQPYYEDLATGEHILPWVRLHAIKDYWGMVALLREFPRVRATFNIVPSLLVQIEAFAEGRARDRHLEAGLKFAERLDTGERSFLVANGFHTSERIIRSFPRYAELQALRLAGGTFSIDDLRDLQVLHKLAWMDPDWLLWDARLRELVGKGRDFGETDKALLREVELELLNAVIPIYRELANTGRVELSTSPFYHPILPLLCDTDTHLRAHPESRIPTGLFARPGDAADQLDRALALHQKMFGAVPQGIWPSEGSVSDDTIALLAERGWQWTATDEEVLARSLGHPLTADALYRPYEVGREGATTRCLFRDHALSDAIGFTYQSWDADHAADDFVAKVRDAGRRFDSGPGGDRSGEVAVVTVILDGENAWEHYPGGGRPFLRSLYQRLQAAEDIETVTMAEAAASPARRLPSIYPGSWINADFYIWAGHADDHRAWSQLAAARDAFDAHSARASGEDRERAWEELLIAEGSDWFWWYGDDHSSDHDRAFDDLFRRHLRNVYSALGQPPPAELHLTNISTDSARVSLPALTRPLIDGAGHLDDWAGSVAVNLSAGAGTMHQVEPSMVKSLHLAADLETMFLRVDAPELVSRIAAGELSLAIVVDRPRQLRVDVRSTFGGIRWAAASVVEVGIPFQILGVHAGEALSFSVVILDAAGQIVEQEPAHHPIEFLVPAAGCQLPATNSQFPI